MDDSENKQPLEEQEVGAPSQSKDPAVPFPVPQNNGLPPPYTDVLSAPPGDALEHVPPPEYFAITVIPEAQILPTDVVYHVKANGNIESFDPKLDANAEELYRYFLSFSQKPSMAVHVRGTHSETRTRVVTYTTGNGNTATRVETYQVEITDFDFSLDVSHYIYPGWSRIVVVPKKDGSGGTVRQLLEEYTGSGNKFKE
ncbi:hypothetical protein BDK51DRAFT_25839 [Blyttiomyces helicus]|uniref:Uncharacterized protein n=1 Tax=Blyttiomyces helicus TaxID=388810 RepID=A0A4P9W395_9FUNG|nr:hypothetical protein BDK51DRAFT_25839 [Blyttiomyces helicus]|eukprot:RKO86262.1 hypothetical protein BDK51DRAFT_25839 [Blyttiomyces helicus]